MVVVEKISTLGFPSLRKACLLFRGRGPSLASCLPTACKSAWLSSACSVSSGGWAREGTVLFECSGSPGFPLPHRSSGLPRRAMPASSTIHVLQLLRELLAFVLLSYTVLIGALLLAGWTTYFLVLK